MEQDKQTEELREKALALLMQLSAEERNYILSQATAPKAERKQAAPLRP